MIGKSWRIGFIGLVVLAGCSGSVLGATAVSVTEPTIGQPANGEQSVVFGWTFMVTGSSPITVTHVGVYDEGGNGLGTAHEVGIWHGGTLVAGSVTTVPVGTAGKYEAGYRYVELKPPIELVPDGAVAYTIGVLFPSDNADPFIKFAGNVAFGDGGAVVEWWSPTYEPEHWYSREAISTWLIRPSTANVTQRGLNVNFKYQLSGAPVAEAGPDVETCTFEQATTTIVGTATDADSSASLQYRWLEGDTVLQDWTGVGLLGTANLNLADVPVLAVGDHILTLEVSDGATTVSDSMTLNVETGIVQIDIKPGSLPNTINLGANGVIPVAILSSPDFSALTVNAATVQFEGKGEIRVKGNGAALTEQRDVNGDGLVDLVLKIEIENLEPGDFQDGEAEVKGQTTTGVSFKGTDQMTIVPPQ